MKTAAIITARGLLSKTAKTFSKFKALYYRAASRGKNEKINLANDRTFQKKPCKSSRNRFVESETSQLEMAEVSVSTGRQLGNPIGLSMQFENLRQHVRHRLDERRRTCGPHGGGSQWATLRSEIAIVAPNCFAGSRISRASVEIAVKQSETPSLFRFKSSTLSSKLVQFS